MSVGIIEFDNRNYHRVIHCEREFAWHTTAWDYILGERLPPGEKMGRKYCIIHRHTAARDYLLGNRLLPDKRMEREDCRTAVRDQLSGDRFLHGIAASR